MSELFQHELHHRTRAHERGDVSPTRVADHLPKKTWYQRFNSKLAIWITVGVGSMTCAYLFAALAFAGLPTALKPGNIGFLFWFSSDLLQLTLLSVIIVGQNIQAAASDKRAEETYKDAEAVLHEALQIQAHLEAQDAVLTQLASPGVTPRPIPKAKGAPPPPQDVQPKTTHRRPGQV